MNSFAIVIAAILATASASDLFEGFKDNRAREAAVNAYNAQRQAEVNRIAEKVGASSGTFYHAGVPGTDLRGKGYGYAPYNQGYQAYPGYAYPGYGYDNRAQGQGYAYPSQEAYNYAKPAAHENKAYDNQGQTYNGYAPH